jgi:acyl-CoA synthetase (AMP-forming)/AMP-acid ligase II
MDSLVETLARWGTDEAGRVAVYAGGARLESVTFGQLLAQARWCSHKLRGMSEPGAVVILSCGNAPIYHAWLMGGWMAGLKIFVVPPSLTTIECGRACEESGAVLWIGESPAAGLPHLAIGDVGEADRACDAAGVDDRETGILLQSSGTTGSTKIVFRDVRSLAVMGEHLREAIGCGVGDRVLACVPVNHSYGIEHGVLMPMMSGTAVELHNGFELHHVQTAIDRGVTILPGVPFMFDVMSQIAGGSRASLRLAYSAGAVLPMAVFEGFERRFGLRLGQVYGASEVGSLTFNDPSASWFDPASVGRGLHGVSVRVMENGEAVRAKPQALSEGNEGEVAVRTPTMLTRFVGREAAAPLLVDGHWLTGDLGRERGGVLTLTGRIKLIIDIGGLKVNPIEVETVLREHPQVRDAVVFAVPVSETVQRLRAVVEPAAGVDTASVGVAGLRAWARERLSQHKVPRLVEVWPALPRTATGKILRKRVEEGR